MCQISVGGAGGLFFRQGGTSFLSEGHPMGSSILMGEGGIQKNRRMGGGGGAPIMGNPGHILHVAAVLDTPLILLFDLLRGCIRKLGCN